MFFVSRLGSLLRRRISKSNYSGDFSRSCERAHHSTVLLCPVLLNVQAITTRRVSERHGVVSSRCPSLTRRVVTIVRVDYLTSLLCVFPHDNDDTAINIQDLMIVGEFNKWFGPVGMPSDDQRRRTEFERFANGR